MKVFLRYRKLKNSDVPFVSVIWLFREGMVSEEEVISGRNLMLKVTYKYWSQISKAERLGIPRHDVEKSIRKYSKELGPLLFF